MSLSRTSPAASPVSASAPDSAARSVDRGARGSSRSPTDLYNLIAWELHLPVERNRAALYRSIQSEVTRLITECRVAPVLVIGEAQNLRNDVLEDLRLLTNYAMDSENRLALLLISVRPSCAAASR
jgi:hypothetical protein